MTFRPYIAADPSAFQVRASARVATVAQLLDCHPADVRGLLLKGELEWHRKGIRGIRVFLDSVRDYQDRQASPRQRCAAPLVHRRKHPSGASTAAFRSAMAGLAAKGLL
jgi:hypothetical protein